MTSKTENCDGFLSGLAGQIEARQPQAQARVDKLTPSLIARAFRGQLVPQDPNDEPLLLCWNASRIKSGGFHGCRR